jgi:hypothetical protein
MINSFVYRSGGYHRHVRRAAGLAGVGKMIAHAAIWASVGRFIRWLPPAVVVLAFGAAVVVMLLFVGRRGSL